MREKKLAGQNILRDPPCPPCDASYRNGSNGAAENITFFVYVTFMEENKPCTMILAGGFRVYSLGPGFNTDAEVRIQNSELRTSNLEHETPNSEPQMLNSKPPCPPWPLRDDSFGLRILR
jgi:hypothetical protein